MTGKVNDMVRVIELRGIVASMDGSVKLIARLLYPRSGIRCRYDKDNINSSM